MLLFRFIMSNLQRSNFQGHPFHLVSPSPWPFFTCTSLLTLTTAGVLTMHAFANAGYWLACGFICLVSSMSLWFRDVIAEGKAKSFKLNLFPRLKIARAIPQEEKAKILVKFHEEKSIKINSKKNQNNFFYYLAGLAFYYNKNIFLL